MNILFVAPLTPFPPNNGARLIVAQLARQLSRAHNLYFIGRSVRKPPYDPEMDQHFKDLALVPRREPPGLRKWVHSLRDPLPLWVRREISDETRRVVREML